MKIVINKCFGGFGLSLLAHKEYLKRKGKKAFFYKQTMNEWRDDKNEYIRMEKLTESDRFDFCATKDLGKKTNKWPDSKDNFYYGDVDRTDPDLVAVVEKLGDDANGWAANLVVVDIPDGAKYSIDDYDGVESVHEAHEVWG